MILKTFEKTVRVKKSIEHHELQLNVNSNDPDFAYDDVEANLFINGVFIADLGHILSKMGVFTDLVDGIETPRTVNY